MLLDLKREKREAGKDDEGGRKPRSWQPWKQRERHRRESRGTKGKGQRIRSDSGKLERRGD